MFTRGLTTWVSNWYRGIWIHVWFILGWATCTADREQTHHLKRSCLSHMHFYHTWLLPCGKVILLYLGKVVAATGMALHSPTSVGSVSIMTYCGAAGNTTWRNSSILVCNSQLLVKLHVCDQKHTGVAYSTIWYNFTVHFLLTSKGLGS